MPPSTKKQACKLCYRTKEGRMTTPPRSSQVVWACWECLPMGQGKGEASAATPTAPSARLITAAKEQGLSLIGPLQSKINALSITDAADYEGADGLLTRVRDARKTWKAKLAPILDPLQATVKAAKLALKGADDLFDEVDAPLGQLEDKIRKEMKAFKVEEQRLIEDGQRKQAALQRQIDEAKVRQDNARTTAQRAKGAAVVDHLEEKQAEVFEATPTAVTAAGSNNRRVKKVRVKDAAAFLAFIAENYEEMAEFAEFNQPRLNRQFKDDPDGIKAWPGVEVYTDVEIVGR